MLKIVYSAIYTVTVLFSTSYYTVYSYIEPFMQQIAHMSDTWITRILTVFGVSGLLESIIFTLYNQFRFVLIRLEPDLPGRIIFSAGSGFTRYEDDYFRLCCWGITATVFTDVSG